MSALDDHRQNFVSVMNQLSLSACEERTKNIAMEYYMHYRRANNDSPRNLLDLYELILSSETSTRILRTIMLMNKIGK